MEHAVLIFGSLVGVAAILAVLFRFIKQSAIIAFIAVGLLAGLMREQVHIPHEVTEIFTELGIILLLFMAGLEMDFKSLMQHWRVIVANGLGQILINTAMGLLLGLLLLDVGSLSALLYFGLCLTFSSTIIVISVLKRRQSMESYHGQIILGLMVMQDITAVLSLVVLKSMGGEGSMALSLAMVGLKMLLLVVCLAVLAKLILRHAFRYLAESRELLFIGSLGWALGIAAICEAFHFSPEIGAFVAGAAISFLPYKLEIQDKVEPMKDFGIILFFIALGYNLKLEASLVSLLPTVAIIAMLVFLGTPLLMLSIGYATKSKSRPSFYIGVTINQISEFSLILATLCVQAKVFDQEIFTIITLATVATIFLSSFGHQFIEQIYAMLRKPLSILDQHSKSRFSSVVGEELRDHLILIKYNELSEKIIQHFLTQRGDKVLLIDLDPEVYENLSQRHEHLNCMYADVFDPDTWDEANFKDARGIVSCLVSGQEAELGILNWMKDNELEIPFVATTDSNTEALALYKAGATFVVQTEALAAKQVGLLLEELQGQLHLLTEHGRNHHSTLSNTRSKNDFYPG